jgi:hypothetical protein
LRRLRPGATASSETLRVSSGGRDFRDRATGLLRSKDPVLVTRRGRLVGIFFPTPEVTLPIELKRELFPILSEEIRRQLRRRRLSERDVKTDFESWCKMRRSARRRH